MASYLFFAAIGLNYLLNFVALFFFIRYLQNDDDYERHYNKHTCSANIFKALSTVLSHKSFNVIFCCLFNIQVFRGKVSMTSVFTPLNIIMYLSLLPSALAVGAASYACYQVQELLMTSVIFIESIDCIIVTILNLIFTLWATVRT